MKALRTFFEEAVGFFVDDWVCALTVVGWIAFYAVLQQRVMPRFGGLGLLAGLAVIPLIFAVRQARRTVPRK